MNVVTHNLQGMFSNRQLGLVTVRKKKSTEKLSSGYKINRAADDAAGLTISENMRRMIRGLTQASANVQDGVSLCQVADGYLEEVHDMLHRITELSVKGSNGTLTSDDRQSINEEVSALKEEMRRIFNVANFNEIPLFHVPYTPDILTAPTDMEVFHIGDGGVGGLEFNNVRYNISELQNEGLKIDDFGIATEDFEVSFDLWDGETVDLSMKKGQSIENAVRNYKWTADGSGIYINNKLSAEWSEVIGPDGNGVTDTTTFSAGMYSFSHHGMNLEFGIDEEATLEEVMSGINGDGATQPSTWDVSVGGASSLKAADIINGVRTIRVTNSNKDVIDYNYTVVADENGIAVKGTNPNNPNDYYVTNYVSWNSFRDSSKSDIVDENGNTITTNGGYPISDWGANNDGNNPSSITFDGDATYHYLSPDANIPIWFDFKLAESASLEEVKQALNGAVLSQGDVNSPGTLTGSGRIMYGSIEPGSNSNIANSFELQRIYGRDFDNDWSITATLFVTRTHVEGGPSEYDIPDETGHYPDDSHRVEIRGQINSNVPDVITPGPDTTVEYYVERQKRVETSYDENGLPIQKTDENGHGIVDSNGNPVYETHEEYDYTCYKYREYDANIQRTLAYVGFDIWDEQVKYTFEGSINGTNMVPVEKDQWEQSARYMYWTRPCTFTRRYYVLDEVEWDDLPDNVKDEVVNSASSHDLATLPSYKRNNSELVSRIQYGEYALDRMMSPNKGEPGEKMINEYEIDFNDGSNTLFSFTFTGSDFNKFYTLSHENSKVRIGTITLSSNGPAYLKTAPRENNKIIRQSEFNNLKLNVPTKKLNIQAGANKGNTITMEWSPLNLTIIGLSGANTLTQESSQETIGMVQNALDVISETRSTFGAYQNRFEHTIRNLDNIVENTQAAETLIRDADMSKEMVKYAKENILEQVDHSLLAQANQSQQGVLALFK